jgi:hypothetical protein
MTVNICFPKLVLNLFRGATGSSSESIGTIALARHGYSSEVLQKISSSFVYCLCWYMYMGSFLRRLYRNRRRVLKTASQRRHLWRRVAAQTLHIPFTHAGNVINGAEKVRSVEMQRQFKDCNGYTTLLKQRFWNVSASDMAKIISSSSFSFLYKY